MPHSTYNSLIVRFIFLSLLGPSASSHWAVSESPSKSDYSLLKACLQMLSTYFEFIYHPLLMLYLACHNLVMSKATVLRAMHHLGLSEYVDVWVGGLWFCW